VGKVEQGIKDGIAWENSILQGPRIKTGDERAASIREAVFNAPIHWREIYPTVETVGIESINGEDAYRVLQTPTEGNAVTMYYSVETGLAIRTTTTVASQMGEIPVETTMSEYKEFGGVLFPTKITQKAAGQDITRTVDSVEINVDIPDGRFDLPEAIKAPVKGVTTHVPAQEEVKPVANYAMTTESPITMRGKNFDYDHEIRVALPAAYHVRPDEKYPVLWVTDGAFAFNLTVGMVDILRQAFLVPELIVFSVGAPNRTGIEGAERRNSEFAPPGEQYLFDGLGGDYLKKLNAENDLDNAPHRADEFLAFLIDEVRPVLAEKYRMKDDHALFGHSGGGMFTAYALFARPGAFSKYIIGSPSINGADRRVFQMEQEYAENHDDFDVSIFFGAGESEIHNTYTAAWGIVSATALLAETLQLRRYRSLHVTTRIFPGKDHVTVIPDVLFEGLQFVY
jgi:predicted alpha/beta superfamily hydrolase